MSFLLRKQVNAGHGVRDSAFSWESELKLNDSSFWLRVSLGQVVMGYFRRIVDVLYLLSMIRIYTPISICSAAEANNFPL